MANTDLIKESIREEEKEKYLELNNMCEEDLNDQDVENIEFNTECRGVKYPV